MELPDSLKALRPYLQHARQVGGFEPLVAYYCEFGKVQFSSISIN